MRLPSLKRRRSAAKSRILPRARRRRSATTSAPRTRAAAKPRMRRRSAPKLRVPEAGQYEAVSSTHVTPAAHAVISFGHNGSRDFGYVLFVLAGGLLLAAILGIGTAIVARTSIAD